MTVMDEFIERRIITGMIVSTDYLRFIHAVFKPRLLDSMVAKTVAKWCLEYFEQYNAAPGRDIEGIFAHKVRRGLGKDQSDEIEQLLSGMNREFVKNRQFNVAYLTDQTWEYFQQQHLKNHIDEIQSKLEAGVIKDATAIATSFAPVEQGTNTTLDPFENLERVRAAFDEKSKPLIKYGKALGNFWDDQMTRDAFVAFLGPEKRGKTFWLIEIAMKGIMNGCNVAFFQAGDMSESQMLRRLCVYLTKRSDKAKYCEEMYIPVLDCVNNQLDICRKAGRESKYGVLDKEMDLKKPDFALMVEKFGENPHYKPCHNCSANRGTIWLEKRKEVNPLTGRDAVRKMVQFRRRYHHRLRLSTYPNETLTVAEIQGLLDNWERAEGFIPDIIVIDYADILAPDPDCTRLDYRNQQNKVWQRLRRLSQQRHCLVVTATQAAATSYEHDTLRLSDFSETKTKYAHVTAMYGLNQTDEEKRVGLMRLNEIVVREGDFDRSKEIKVLQKLQMGKPFLGSFD